LMHRTYKLELTALESKNNGSQEMNATMTTQVMGIFREALLLPQNCGSDHRSRWVGRRRIVSWKNVFRIAEMQVLLAMVFEWEEMKTLKPNNLTMVWQRRLMLGHLPV